MSDQQNHSINVKPTLFKCPHPCGSTDFLIYNKVLIAKSPLLGKPDLIRPVPSGFKCLKCGNEANPKPPEAVS